MSLLLTNEDVERILDMPIAIDALAPVYAELARGGAVLRPQSQTYLPGPLEHSSYCLKTNEGGSEGLGVMAIRITSDVLQGRQVNGVMRREKLAAAPGGKFLGLVLLFSISTGELLAILPDGIIQRLRVGAVSALAAGKLAREDASIVGLIGAGNQAEAQLRGLACVRPIREVRVYSPTAERREDFAARMAEVLDVPIEAMDHPAKAIRGADIVATATNSGKPVLDGAWLEPGMHVGFIREFEADDATLARAGKLFVHTTQGDIDHHTPRGKEALAELQRGRGHPWGNYPELADLLTGAVEGRTSPDELTMFMNNFGIGLQFAALGARAWHEASAHGLGQDIPSDWFLESIQP